MPHVFNMNNERSHLVNICFIVYHCYMSLPINILEILMYYNGGYRVVRERMKERCAVSDDALRVTLSRMKKAGLIANESHIWNMTSKGRLYLSTMQRKQKLTPEPKPKLPLHTARQNKSKPKTMIVVFDIPETQKRSRRWLRVELSNLGFTMLQKSVWFGPAPLPRECIQSLHHMKMLRYIRFFRAIESDII